MHPLVTILDRRRHACPGRESAEAFVRGVVAALDGDDLALRRVDRIL